MAHVAELQTHRVYRHQVPVEVGGVCTRAMVDSGNLWRNVISTEFMAKLGYTREDLRPVAGSQRVSTARKGATLEIWGELPRNVKLRLGTHHTTFLTRPVVLNGLTMDFNISGPFLKKYHIDQLHSQDCLRVQGRSIPLLQARTPHKKTTCNLYLDRAVRLPPWSINHVQLRAPDVVGGLMKAKDGIVEGDYWLAEKKSVLPWSGAVVSCSKNGRLVAGLMNMTGKTIRLAAGLRYGTLEHLLHDGRRLCALGPEGKEASREEKRANIERLLKLKEAPALANEEDQAKARALMEEFYDVFSWDGQYGHTQLLQHEIRLQPDTQPIRSRYRPPNPSLEPVLKKQLQEWEDQGVIEPSNSPWNFPLVAVPKKNGKIRWCVDYRRLNMATIKDTHPIGNIEDNLVRLARSTMFSTIDATGAYHVVEIAEGDKEKTAFATPWGTYHFCRLPFGLCNAPSTYARLVSMVLQGLPPQRVLPYLDDIIIHSSSVEEHLVATRHVLEAHRKAGLKLNPEKCHFFQHQVEYLGHVVSKDGVRPVPGYVEVVKKWPVPRSREQIRAFLGKTGYYRRFIRNYVGIALPLTNRLKDDGTKDKEEFEPTPEMIQAVEELKKRLTEAPILAYPRFDSDEPFIVDTDWSLDNNAVGGVLSQVQEGRERVIAYGGKKLTKGQMNYTATKGELAAVITFLNHWRYYLQHRQFILRTDHQALKWVYTMEAPQGMIQRWLDTLANFDFVVKHRAGKQHGNADGLSRAPHLTATEVNDLDDQAVRLLALWTDTSQAWTPEEWAVAQEEDEDLRPIRAYLRQGGHGEKPETRALSGRAQLYWSYLESLTLDSNQILRYKKVITRAPGAEEQRNLAVVPSQWQSEALRKAHVASAHKGPAATVERALRYVYFPGMLKKAEEVVRTCRNCQEAGERPQPQRHTLVAHQQGYPFQKLAIDFVGPLPASRQGSRYILTVLDTFTKWVEAFPLRAATAEAACKQLATQVFARYGLPESLHSDRGSQFTSDLLQEMAQQLGIRKTETPAYNPKSNPVERIHRDLERALTALVEQSPRHWEDRLPQVLFAMRTAVSRTTGFAPYQLLFGRDPSTTLELLFGAPLPEGHTTMDPDDWGVVLRNRIMSAHAWARKNIAKAIDRQRRAYHKDKKAFSAGQRVWLFTPRVRPGQSKKLATYWTGPWTIHSRVNEVMYRLAPDATWVRRGQEVVSVDRLKPYYEAEGDQQQIAQPPPVDADLAMDGDEHAEHVEIDDREDDDLEWHEENEGEDPPGHDEGGQAEPQDQQPPQGRPRAEAFFTPPQTPARQPQQDDFYTPGAGARQEKLMTRGPSVEETRSALRAFQEKARMASKDKQRSYKRGQSDVTSDYQLRSKHKLAAGPPKSPFKDVPSPEPVKRGRGRPKKS